jgi:hypothetical protein
MDNEGKLMLARTALVPIDRSPLVNFSEGRLIVARAVFDWMARYPSTRDSNENVISVAEDSRK